MISLDQVILLEQKVESAVAKIQQLQTENDALRSKCEQLTNALSAKSEQLNTFETDQNQIEDGIKKALDRLNAIENSVLKTASAMQNNGQVASTFATMQPVQQEAQVAPTQQVQNTTVQTQQTVQQTVNTTQVTPTFTEESFDLTTEKATPETFEQSFETFDEEEPQEDDSDENSDGLGFDIF